VRSGQACGAFEGRDPCSSGSFTFPFPEANPTGARKSANVGIRYSSHTVTWRTVGSGWKLKTPRPGHDDQHASGPGCLDAQVAAAAVLVEVVASEHVQVKPRQEA
jgi:hypothetical protein